MQVSNRSDIVKEAVEQLPVDRVLLPDNTAVSPFESYPGKITFPDVFLFGRHQEFTRAIREAEPGETAPIMFNIGGDKYAGFNHIHYRMALKWAKIEIKDHTNPKKPKKLKVGAIETMPMEAAIFIGLAGFEYIRRHTTFPGFRGGSVAVAEGRSENGKAVGA